MKVNIDKLLNKQGKSMYWLAKEVKVTYPNLHKLCTNNANSIKFDTLEKICIVLDCEPNDLFEIEKKSV